MARQNFYLTAALFLAVAMTAVVGTALGFEHIGGFIPCKLCLEQREPYYAAIPVALIAAAAAAFRWPAIIARLALGVVGLAMTYGFYLAVFHSGVEWGWWPGPTDCGAAATSGLVTEAEGLLGALDTVTPPSCDEAAGRFLGLSFAGWNVLASAVIAAGAYYAALRKPAA
ncbi:disulfide bond formation protein B [Oricola cellulosilytica]|uniref:Disulfide bond formation protein B n=1 Tax=Oricola cellulosilytica TaxID=1429082 RepID=A0A4R0P9T5_9HYPH|nr:disulfide bond formation protein B [Oricola cellulosilytica]TCD13695.1 disulfide bond formation protein B [Oricola cellulosilytica]